MNNELAQLAVQFDRATELGFLALFVATLLSPLVSLVLGYRRGIRAGVFWSVGFCLVAEAVFLIMVGSSIGDGDDSTSNFVVSAFALVLVPNLLLALLGRGFSAVIRRRGNDA